MAGIRARRGPVGAAVVVLTAVAAGLLFTGHPLAGATLHGAPAGGVVAPSAACPIGRSSGSAGWGAYVARRGAVARGGRELAPGRAAHVPAGAPAAARLTMNKLAAYYRGIVARDLGRELVVASTCPTAVAAADPAAERAVAAYRSQVRQHAAALVPRVQRLAAAVRTGDRAAARVQYRSARAHWEQVRSVVTATTAAAARERWDAVGRRVDGRVPLAGLAPVTDRLVADARAAQARAVTAPLSVVTISRNAKELFDDDPADAVVLRAEVDSAWAAYDALRPLAADPGLVGRLDAAFRDARRELSAGRGQDPAQRRDLARLADALAAPLSQLAAAV